MIIRIKGEIINESYKIHKEFIDYIFSLYKDVNIPCTLLIWNSVLDNEISNMLNSTNIYWLYKKQKTYEKITIDLINDININEARFNIYYNSVDSFIIALTKMISMLEAMKNKNLLNEPVDNKKKIIDSIKLNKKTYRNVMKK